MYGMYIPFLLGGAIISTIGAGLIYTLDIGSPSSQWIGYQALAGIGIGLALQVPIIANQAFVKMSEISSVTAITLCTSLLPHYSPSPFPTLHQIHLQPPD